MMVVIESQKARKFLKGLRADIFNCIAILKPSSYVKVLKHAQVAEKLVAAQHQCITHICAQQ